MDFINAIESKDDEKVLTFLERDNQLAIIIASTTKNLPDLRRKIIESLPNDKNIQKDKLFILLNYDEQNFDEAFEILKQIDLTDLSYFECQPILKIIHEKKAWDFEIIVLEKLLKKEKSEIEKFTLKSQLFNAYFNLNKYVEAIGLGEQLIKQDSVENILDSKNREILIADTILACFERGKVDNSALKKSQKILEEYQLPQPSFDFKVGIEAKVYLKNDDPRKALKSVVQGVKIKKILSPEEYTKLYFLLTIEIGRQIDLKLDSLKQVEENTFIKFDGKDQWYFIGDDNELDAIKIPSTNTKHSLLVDKKVGDKIDLSNEYSLEKSEKTIEKIFLIEQYILWQTIHNSDKLSKDDFFDGIQMIAIPEKEGTIDPQYLLKFLENTYKQTEPFFDMYYNNSFPLAVLAVNEGGITNAIGRIQQENRGFINFSLGTSKELEMQKNTARNTLTKKLPFYIDGTSAIILSEVGLFEKIYSLLPNLKVPQSVISLLANITEKFSYIRGQAGQMGYAQGKIVFSSVEDNKRRQIQANFLKSINLLESKPKNITVISPANKVDCFSEQKIPGELSDACILAQKEDISVLTEDLFYLKMNELETKKKSPEYFSSWALLRVLYEEAIISFDDYIDFFGYLSFYRFRFLPLSIDDIEKTVFGDGRIKIVNPENIRKLNFRLTLSEEYGVTFQKAFSIVGKFILKLLNDNTVSPEITERIFIEILESFPTRVSKKTIAYMFASLCFQAEKQNTSKLILPPKNIMKRNKIDKLLEAIKIYNPEIRLLTPN